MTRRILSLLLCLAIALSGSSRKTVALVLGGGGAKGAAEVGVLKYIERSGVPIDMVVGTSIGSVVGGLYSVGYSADEMDRIFRSQEWTDLFSDGISVDNLLDEVVDSPLSVLDKVRGLLDFKSMVKELGIVKGDSIVGFLDRLIREKASSSPDYEGPALRVVAVDLKDMSEVVLRNNSRPHDISMNMRASMAIPLVFRPVQQSGMLLADGGVLNNLPVDVARGLGADIVIAVDLTQNKPKKGGCYDFEDESSSYWGTGESVQKLLDKVPWLSWVMKRPDRQKYNRNVKDADVYINPTLDDCSVMSFAKVDYMIQQGEKAGKKALRKLKKIKKKARK